MSETEQGIDLLSGICIIDYKDIIGTDWKPNAVYFKYELFM